MTPKILKAGLLVGTLVFALVSCGQNTKPTENLPADVPLNSGGEWTGKITTVIKDKDSDSLTLSNFSSTNAAVATIGVDKASNPTEIIITAGTLVPGTGQQRATVSFQVSDGTETITVSVKVTVTAPPLACMLGPAIVVPSECPDGSLYNPIVIRKTDDPSEDGEATKYRFADYITATAETPNYQVTVAFGAAEIYVVDTGTEPVACTTGGAEECFTIGLHTTGGSRKSTPEGVTAILKLTAATNQEAYVYVEVIISSSS